jgi:hypothetical protein
MSQFYINLDIEREERYDFAKFLEFSSIDLEFDPLTSKFLEKLKDIPSSGLFIVGALENRIDLISNAIYGDPQLWWIVMEYNRLSDPEDIPANTMLKYPSILDLEILYFTLNSDKTQRGA